MPTRQRKKRKKEKKSLGACRAAAPFSKGGKEHRVAKKRRKKRRMRSMKQQLTHAVRQSSAIGQSKHADKGLGRKGVRHDGRSYSYAALNGRLDTAKNFAGFLQREYPEIKRAVDIKAEHVNAFLTEKAATVNNDTLKTYASNLRSIVKEIGNCYHTDLHIKKNDIVTPIVDREPWRTCPMEASDIKRLHESFKPGSTGDRAMILSHATGARAEEICTIKREDIHIKGDTASVTITGKGGRTREVHVEDVREIAKLNEIRLQTPPGGRICPIKVDSLHRNVERHMKAIEIKDRYKYTSIHAMRKEWAQRTYDKYRQNHSKLETIKYVNVQLGHGADRDVVLLGRYCNVW